MYLYERSPWSTFNLLSPTYFSALPLVEPTLLWNSFPEVWNRKETESRKPNFKKEFFQGWYCSFKEACGITCLCVCTPMRTLVFPCFTDGLQSFNIEPEHLQKNAGQVKGAAKGWQVLSNLTFHATVIRWRSVVAGIHWSAVSRSQGGADPWA